MNYQEIRNIVEEVVTHQSRETREYIDARLSEHYKNIDTRLEYFGKEISSIVKIVRDGNGQAPLVTRVVSLEKDVETLREQNKAHSEESIVNTQGRWQVWAALISGLMGLLASAFAIFHQ